MPETERRRPPPVATCEEWNEETQTALPGSATTARISAKHHAHHEAIAGFREHRTRSDGIDSGYVSRADTTITESSNAIRRKMLDLKLDTTAIRERERQPYQMAQATSSKPPVRRQSSSQVKELPPEQRTPKTTKPAVHARGTCRICDQYGRHIDIKKEMSRPASVAPPPPSPTATRQGGPKIAKDDESLRDKTKRPSLARQPRPLSMVQPSTVPLQYINQSPYGPPPMVTTPGWATPTMSFNPVSYSYTPVSPMPGSSYTPYSQMPLYYEPSMELEPLSARPSRRSSPVRRSSTYGDPVIRQSYPEPGMVGLERVSSKENRPPLLESRRSSRVFDNDRHAMPPPPKPQPPPPDVLVVRRPSNRRSKTYHPQDMPLREQPYESDRYDEEDLGYRDSRGHSSANRGRRESPPRPPTSYRGPSVTETRDRPSLPGKSVSYSTPTSTTKVASSKAWAPPRRTTLPAVPLERKEADAEEYLRKSSKTSNELTAEALYDLNHRSAGSRSETGSSYSHKSRQSSSKDSSGRGRSHTSGTMVNLKANGFNMNISTDQMSKEGRPLSISFHDGNNITLSMGPEGKDSQRPNEQRRIERAPSIASRASKKSVSSGVVSNRDQDREVSTRSSRRPSQVEDRAPSLKSSRQHSRAPSANGYTYEFTRRQSVDYSKPYDDPVYGA
jgi:hypothetical protein